MRIVNVHENDKKIQIGRFGENAAVSVHFDVSGWEDLYGAGVFYLLHIRHGDNAPYLCNITRDENTVIWDIASEDVAKLGFGECELIYITDSTIAKSVVFSTNTETAFDYAEEPPEPPEPWESGLRHVLSTAAKAFTYAAPECLALQDNAIYMLTDVGDLTITYPSGDFSCCVILETGDVNFLRIILPASEYLGAIPLFQCNQKWMLLFRNGTVAASFLNSISADVEQYVYIRTANNVEYVKTYIGDKNGITSNFAVIEDNNTLTHPDYPLRTNGTDIFTTDFTAYGYKLIVYEEIPTVDDDHIVVPDGFEEGSTTITLKYTQAVRPFKSLTSISGSLINLYNELLRVDSTLQSINLIAPTEITLQSANYELTNVSNLKLKFPADTSGLKCCVHLTTVDTGDVNISVPTSADIWPLNSSYVITWELDDNGEYQKKITFPQKEKISAGESWTLYVFGRIIKPDEDQHEVPAKPTT